LNYFSIIPKLKTIGP